MIDLRIVAECVNICNRIEHAELLFEELSLMKSPKPNIDIDRRRRAINSRYGFKMKREYIEGIFKEMEQLGIGKLRLHSKKGECSVFMWTEFRFDCVDLGKNVCIFLEAFAYKPAA